MITNNLNINKLASKPEWSEVIKLYSGLFDDENQRTEFIIDLSENDISLAVDCKNESITNESGLKDNLTESSFQKALYFNDHYGSAKAFEALLKLDASDQVSEILASISIPTKIHKKSIQEFILSSGIKELLVFIANVINNDNKQNKNVLDWSFKAIEGRKVFEVTSEIEKYEAIIDSLKYIKNRSELLSFFFSVEAPSASARGHQHQQATDHANVLEEQQLLHKRLFRRSGPQRVKEERSDQCEHGQ